RPDHRPIRRHTDRRLDSRGRRRLRDRPLHDRTGAIVTVDQTAPAHTPEPSPEPRENRTNLVSTLGWKVLPYVASVAMAFVVGALVIIALGHDPIRSLESVLTTSFSTKFGVVETFHKWVPIVLCALAFTIPLSTGKVTIGAEANSSPAPPPVWPSASSGRTCRWSPYCQRYWWPESSPAPSGPAWPHS